MFKNYLKIAYRNIIKQKAYTLINVMGLALGLASCILVGLFIWQDLNYDNYHENGENIYRLSMKNITPSGTSHMAESPAKAGPTIIENFPEVDKMTRIYFSSDDLVALDNNKFYEDEIIFADENFFNIFSYQLISGNPNELLTDKNSIVLTRKISEKYFGSENPVGRTLRLNNKFDMKITGVIENVPANSHFNFDLVCSYSALADMPEGIFLDQWGATFGSYTYLLLHPGTDIDNFEIKSSNYFTSLLEEFASIKNEIILQPIKSIHLHSDLNDEIKPNSSITYILILGSISLFILILACINFVNLTTARAIKRAKEIGVRKVFGAIKQQLVPQFLSESIFLTIIALGFALVIVELITPAFSELIGSEMVYNCFDQIGILVTIVILTLVIGILAGLYPAFVLTHYQPVDIMKGSLFASGKKGSAFLRKCLVLFQFSISIILIIFTVVINQQVDYMRNYDMCFEKDQTIILNTPERMSNNFNVIKSELNTIPGVIKSSASLGAPSLGSGYGTNLIPDMQHEDEEFGISVKMIDFDYLDLYDIELLAGKSLSEFEGADFTELTMVNETTVRKLGFVDPIDAIGNSYTIGLSDGVKRFSPEIVGVVRDFHFNSLHSEISPLLFMYWPYLFQEVSIRISAKNVPATIKGIQQVWEKFYPEYPFNYSFLDEKIDKLYQAEERSFQVITVFSILAIFIACLGLLGLTFYTTEQRRKEIGIRKVLGASITSVLHTISKEFLKLVIIANLIAWPVSFLLMKKWLESFPYQVKISFGVFLLSGFIALAISLITISYTVIRSATSNPIKSLRYE